MAKLFNEGTARKSVLLAGLNTKRFTASTLAIATVLASAVPAWSTIDNTVTATGSSPGNTDDIVVTADEEVDVVDDAPALVLTKSVVDNTTGLPLGANVPAGTVVRYEFAVANTGNVTITDVDINEVSFDGTGSVDPTDATVTTDGGLSAGDSTDGAAGDGVFDTLAPGDTITFTSTYTVLSSDILGEGGGDGTLDNTANATGDSPAATGFGVVTAPDDSASFDLEDQNPQLTVTKIAILDDGVAIADPDTANVAAGSVVTYEYVVSNTGNVPIDDISLADSVTAGTGGNPTPAIFSNTATSADTNDDAADAVFDTLGAGDSVTYRATYTVTQDDVDDLQ